MESAKMAYLGRLAVIVLASFSGSSASVDQRVVKTTLYPDCDQYPACEEARNGSATTGNFPNVAYVRAAGSGSSNADVLHLVLTTISVPSVLVVHTDGADAKLSFNWTQLLRVDNITDMSGAITAVNGTVKYSFAVVFTQLLEYDDINDDAKVTAVTDENLWNIRNFTEFTWMNVTTGRSDRSVIFNTTSLQPNPETNQTTGSLSFEFEINNDGGRDDDLPRLLFTANNTQMNFVLDHYVPTFNQSRFALEIVVITQTQDTPDTMSIEKAKSIDDEFSPGVFELVNWYALDKHRKSGGYIQYKPVCYLARKRERSAGTEVTYYKLNDTKYFPGLNAQLDVSVARAFFGSKSVVQMATNISFGLSEDGFYVKKNYTAWTASIGYGTPPEETVSELVIIIIAAGLGIPVIVIIFGGIYVIIRKCRSRNAYHQLGNVVDGGSYSQIN